MSRRGNLARWTAEKARNEQAKIAALVEEQVTGTDGFTSLRLVRVRKHLDRIDSMLMKETEPQAIQRLAQAQGVLGEQERILAGRPLPGSRRPGPERAGRRRSLEVEPSITSPPDSPNSTQPPEPQQDNPK